MVIKLTLKNPGIEYQESMLFDTIDASIIVINSSNRKGKNLMEGLPLVGTEFFSCN